MESGLEIITFVGDGLYENRAKFILTLTSLTVKQITPSAMGKRAWMTIKYYLRYIAQRKNHQMNNRPGLLDVGD